MNLKVIGQKKIKNCIDNDDTFMKWLIQDYNKNHLIQLSEKYLSSCFPCRVNKVDIVPPKNLVIKYYYD